MKYIYTYMGVTIYRKTTPGYQLRWSAGSLAADTLNGIKELIREQLKRKTI